MAAGAPAQSLRATAPTAAPAAPVGAHCCAASQSAAPGSAADPAPSERTPALRSLRCGTQPSHSTSWPNPRSASAFLVLRFLERLWVFADGLLEYLAGCHQFRQSAPLAALGFTQHLVLQQLARTVERFLGLRRDCPAPRRWACFPSPRPSWRRDAGRNRSESPSASESFLRSCSWSFSCGCGFWMC